MREDELFRLYRRVLPMDEEIPPRYQDAIDRASESDRLSFEGHSDHDVRGRSPIPGEFGPFVDHATIAFVRVDKVDDDTRLRSIILWAGGPQ
jgi:hypothetical protein